MTDQLPSKDLVSRITAYLAGGGLFNPELANHDAVRDLLIACRDALAAHEPRADLQAAAFDLIDVLDAALIGAPDTGLRVRAENYLPVMAAIKRVRSITEAASSQPPGAGQ